MFAVNLLSVGSVCMSGFSSACTCVPDGVIGSSRALTLIAFVSPGRRPRCFFGFRPRFFCWSCNEIREKHDVFAIKTQTLYM